MISGYRLMWLMVMFDLPVQTKKDRKLASKFRNGLLDLGFLRCQFSIYVKFCVGTERTKTIFRYIKNLLPPKGQVSILTITDSQFKKIRTYDSRKNALTAKQPKQLELF